MKNFLNILLLQGSWLLIVLKAKSFSLTAAIAFTLGVLALNYLVFKPQTKIKNYAVSAILFLLVGILHDWTLLVLNVVESYSYSYSYLALWPIFMCYYDGIFKRFKNFNSFVLSILGGVGAVLAYWSCIRLGALELQEGREFTYVFTVFVMWAIFFPGSIKMSYKENIWDWVLDKTVVFSFDNTGFRRHAEKFDEDLSLYDLSRRNVLVTGGSAGIGGEVTKQMSLLGASVCFTGRSADKGKKVEQQFSNSKFASLDMADWKSINEFCKSCEEFDYVVLNAGGMPEEVQFNEQGVEFQCASQLVGHYLMMEALLKYGKLKEGARIVWVSSGGMYLKKLDLETLFSGEGYEKVDTYANVKRAQITLAEELANTERWSSYTITSMHPGWVDTSGLKEALPKFYNIMETRLRSIEQGADTIVWELATEKALESGAFYFDREVVSPYLSKSYSPSELERKELVDRLNKYVDASLDS